VLCSVHCTPGQRSPPASLLAGAVTGSVQTGQRKERDILPNFTTYIIGSDIATMCASSLTEKLI
jgi:hypothetical protein